MFLMGHGHLYYFAYKRSGRYVNHFKDESVIADKEITLSKYDNTLFSFTLVSCLKKCFIFYIVLQ